MSLNNPNITYNQDHINIILNQTNYDRETAIKKLNLYNNDYIKVIKNYLNIPEKTNKIQSLNQKVYSEIRSFLDER